MTSKKKRGRACPSPSPSLSTWLRCATTIRVATITTGGVLGSRKRGQAARYGSFTVKSLSVSSIARSGSWRKNSELILVPLESQLAGA